MTSRRGTARLGAAWLGKARHGWAGPGSGMARHGLHSQQNTIQEAGYEEKN